MVRRCVRQHSPDTVVRRPIQLRYTGSIVFVFLVVTVYDTTGFVLSDLSRAPFFVLQTPPFFLYPSGATFQVHNGYLQQVSTPWIDSCAFECLLTTPIERVACFHASTRFDKLCVIPFLLLIYLSVRTHDFLMLSG